MFRPLAALLFCYFAVSGASGLFNTTLTSPEFNISSVIEQTHVFNVTSGSPANMVISETPVGDVFGAQLEKQPRLQSFDQFGNANDDWSEPVTVTVRAMGGQDSDLQGNRTISLDQGIANFTDISLLKSGVVTLEFNCSTCQKTAHAQVEGRLVLVGGEDGRGRIVSIGSTGNCTDMAPALPLPVRSVASSSKTPVFGTFGEKARYGGLVMLDSIGNEPFVYHGISGTIDQALVIQEDGQEEEILLSGSFRNGMATLRNYELHPTIAPASGMLDPPCVKAMLHTGSSMYLGGCFTRVVNGTGVFGVAKLENNQFYGLSGGVTKNGAPGVVNALAAFNNSLGMHLFAGGDFTHAGGVSSNGVAVWNIGTDQWMSSVGGVSSGMVHGMAVHDFNGVATLVVVGDFTINGGYSGIAEMNIDNGPFTLGAFRGGQSISGSVFSILSRPGQLIVGGNFTRPTHSSNTMQWQGSSFSPLQGCTSDVVVYDLKVLTPTAPLSNSTSFGQQDHHMHSNAPNGTNPSPMP